MAGKRFWTRDRRGRCAGSLVSCGCGKSRARSVAPRQLVACRPLQRRGAPPNTTARGSDCHKSVFSSAQNVLVVVSGEPSRLAVVGTAADVPAALREVAAHAPDAGALVWRELDALACDVHRDADLCKQAARRAGAVVASERAGHPQPFL